MSSLIKPREKNCRPINIRNIPKIRASNGRPVEIVKPTVYFQIVKRRSMPKPRRNRTRPINPKKWSGLVVYLVMNRVVNKSKNPLIKRIGPNLLCPYFLG